MLETKIVGADGNTKLIVDPKHRAGRVSLRPAELGSFGAYRLAMRSGVIAAGIVDDSPVWGFRWGNADPIAIIRKLRLQAVASTTAFGAVAEDTAFNLFRAQGFTALDTTGASVAAWTKAKAAAVATRMASSKLAGDKSTLRENAGGIAISNTGAMSAGTKTLDDNPIAIVVGRVVASAAAETIITPDPFAYLIDPSEGAALSPLELSQNEGLVLTVANIEATGTWRLAVEVEWDEVDPAVYFG